MSLAASSTVVAAGRRAVVANGVPIHTTAFIGTNWTSRTPDSPPPPAPGAFYPMAFLVEQPPGSVVQAHFHVSDQFQVVVAGGAMLGRHAVAPYTVHYTNAHTSYGPIAAGEEGVHYFTLRNHYDPGARYVPGAAPELRQVPNRKYRVATSEPLVPLATRDVAREEVVLPLEADGMGAWRYVLPAGQRLRGPDPADGKGQYWLVVAGSAGRAGEAPLPPLSLLFAMPDEPALELVAGPEGAELLAMQYPDRG